MPNALIRDPTTQLPADFAAGFLAPPGYIDGLELQYRAVASVTVRAGSAYIPSLGYAINLASDTVISFSGSATAFWHAYLYLSGSTPSVELSSTAPSAPYSGSCTGRTKTGDTSRRYLGSIYRNGISGSYANFLQSGNHVHWLTSTVGLVSGGTSTSYTSGGVIDPVAAGACPTTTREIDLRVINSDATYGFVLSNTDASYAGLIGVPPGTNGAYFSAPLSQQVNVGTFNYAFSNSPTSGSATINATGYTFER